jgi:flagellar hook-associated protein 1 FlgK
MSSLGFSIGVSGLKAAQVGMDVTQHNIANVNTPNYQRQVVELSSVTYRRELPSLPSGAGVKVDNIKSINDPFLMNSYPKALSDSSEYEALNKLAAPLNGLLNSDSLNLSTAMQNVFNSFQDVANSPTSIPVRQNAIDNAQSFVDKANSLNSQLGELKTTLQKSQTGSLEKANSLLTQISEVNKQIQSTGGDQSTLLSQRDGLTFDLSQLTGINISSDKSRISTTSGQPLINDGINVTPLKESDLASITGGEIGGTNKFITTMLNPAMEKLPQVLNTVTTAINEQAVKGVGLDSKQGSPIFATNAQGKLSVAVNDPRNIGAALSADAVGDGTNAQNISDIRNNLFNGQTLQGQYGNVLSGFNSKASSYTDMEKLYGSISDDIQKRIQSVSGVNLDEEAANLMKYQRMYEANAQAIKVQNEIFGTLINIRA